MNRVSNLYPGAWQGGLERSNNTVFRAEPSAIFAGGAEPSAIFVGGVGMERACTVRQTLGVGLRARNYMASSPPPPPPSPLQVPLGESNASRLGICAPASMQGLGLG